MSNLAEALPAEQARCRQIMLDAQSIGPNGAFLVAMLKGSLAVAEKAAASGDVVAMLASLADLREYKK